jgi:hypothetical protein
MQSELPKQERLPDDYEFVLGEFLSENWFFLVGFLFIVAVVIFYTIHRRQNRL